MANAMPAPKKVFEEGDAPFADDGAAVSPPVRDGSVVEDIFRESEAPVFPEAAIVVEAKPIPLGPILIVLPSTTIVVGVAEGPTL